jgi:hypothetical protein
MGAGLRKAMLAVHIVVSVGWIGAVAAYLALDFTVVTHPDVQALRASHIAMERVTSWAIVPLAYATLVTGLVMSLGTKWGLFRHYWVIISLVLTLFALGVLLVETQTIGYHARVAKDPATTDEALRALGGTLPHSIGGTVVLLVVTVLNIYKPRGMTAYGWRKQQEQQVVSRP